MRELILGCEADNIIRRELATSISRGVSSYENGGRMDLIPATGPPLLAMVSIPMDPIIWRQVALVDLGRCTTIPNPTARSLLNHIPIRRSVSRRPLTIVVVCRTIAVRVIVRSVCKSLAFHQSPKSTDRLTGVGVVIGIATRLTTSIVAITLLFVC
jgi:hypothetical protein